MKAIILAGGLGKRLRPLTDERPKAMIEVCGIPILGWQLCWLAKHDIKDVIISTGYLKKTVIDYVGHGARFGVGVQYSYEEEPLGTGGGLKKARNLLGRKENFVMLYGDILTDLDPSLLVRELAKNSDNALGAIAAIYLRSPFGIIDVNNDRVRAFREKPVLSDYLMNAGVYCLSPRLLEFLPDKGSFEATTLPLLAVQDKLLVTRYEESIKWRSIDSHKDIEEAEAQFATSVPKILPRRELVANSQF